MVTSSYPRFPGDIVGTFLEPIAHAGIASRRARRSRRGTLAPVLRRPSREEGVSFHLYRYAPHPSLNVFGYAGALREDVRVAVVGVGGRASPLAAGWWKARSVAGRVGATVMHGHWVVPGGATRWIRNGRRCPSS